jgi:hypothetical protein
LSPSAPDAGTSVKNGAVDPATVGATLFSANVAGATPSAMSLAWTQDSSGCFRNYTINQTDAGRTVGTMAVVKSVTADQLYFGGLPALARDWGGGNLRTFDVNLTDNNCHGSASADVAVQLPPGPNLVVNLTGPGSIALRWTNSGRYGGLLEFGYYRVYQFTPTSEYIANISDVNSRYLNLTPVQRSSQYAFEVFTFDRACAGCATQGPSVTESNSSTTGVITPPLTCACGPHPLNVVFDWWPTVAVGASAGAIAGAAVAWTFHRRRKARGP